MKVVNLSQFSLLFPMVPQHKNSKCFQFAEKIRGVKFYLFRTKD